MPIQVFKIKFMDAIQRIKLANTTTTKLQIIAVNTIKILKVKFVCIYLNMLFSPNIKLR